MMKVVRNVKMTKDELLMLRYKPVSSTDSAGEHRVKMLNASLGIVKYNVYTYKANGDFYAKRWSWYYNGQLYQMYEADKLVEAINRSKA